MNALPGGRNLDENPRLVDPGFFVELNEGAGLFDGSVLVEGKTSVDFGRNVSGYNVDDLAAKVDRYLVLELSTKML